MDLRKRLVRGVEQGSSAREAARRFDPAAFVFLDETGTATNMVRRYGWAPKHQRLVDAAPHGHWRTTTFVAGLRSTKIIASLVLDGPITGETFQAYVTQFLAPSLCLATFSSWTILPHTR